jgi:hypothetical protein
VPLQLRQLTISIVRTTQKPIARELVSSLCAGMAHAAVTKLVGAVLAGSVAALAGTQVAVGAAEAVAERKGIATDHPALVKFFEGGRVNSVLLASGAGVMYVVYYAGLEKLGQALFRDRLYLKQNLRRMGLRGVALCCVVDLVLYAARYPTIDLTSEMGTTSLQLQRLACLSLGTLEPTDDEEMVRVSNLPKPLLSAMYESLVGIEGSHDMERSFVPYAVLNLAISAALFRFVGYEKRAVVASFIWSLFWTLVEQLTVASRMDKFIPDPEVPMWEGMGPESPETVLGYLLTALSQTHVPLDSSNSVTASLGSTAIGQAVWGGTAPDAAGKGVAMLPRDHHLIALRAIELIETDRLRKEAMATWGLSAAAQEAKVEAFVPMPEDKWSADVHTRALITADAAERLALSQGQNPKEEGRPGLYVERTDSGVGYSKPHLARLCEQALPALATPDGQPSRQLVESGLAIGDEGYEVLMSHISMAQNESHETGWSWIEDVDRQTRFYLPLYEVQRTTREVLEGRFGAARAQTLPASAMLSSSSPGIDDAVDLLRSVESAKEFVREHTSDRR